MEHDDIRHEASRALAAHLRCSACDIGLEVREGSLELHGEVEWSYQRERAEAAVRRLDGVEAVENDLVLRPRLPARDIRLNLARALERRAQPVGSMRAWAARAARRG